MPFVRDYAYSTSGGTSSTSATCGVPDYVQNDLLIALISADGSLPANTTSVTATGWTNIGFYSTAGTNACGMSILVKYASASEPVDYTFTGLGSDTNNSMIISIGDCFFDGGTGANAIQNRTTSTNVSNWTGTAQANVRITYPAVTTAQDDTLMLYFGVGAGTGTTGVVTIVEGASLIIGKDGGAHCDGAGWLYKKTAGTIATNTVFANIVGVSSAAGFIAQLAVRPPSGGITVLAPYVVSDSSRLINMGTGITGFNGYSTTAYSGTAANSTMFPTATLTLNGRPVVAGGTTYTTTDQGVNTFHSGLTITGVVTSGSWASNTTAHPAMTDLAGENILFHVSPSTPASGQPVDSVALAGACGFAIGLASTAGNCKVWHVHGNGTPWGQARWVPCVINTSNTTGVIGTGGSINNASITNIGMFLSCKGIAGAYTAVSIWKMGTTVLAGGSANRPFLPIDIVKQAADGKERRSIINQGADQFYVLQQLQFGDGGTNPIYLNIDNASFEFPKQYDKEARIINYCSVDNKVGFTFYPGASDTISFKNALFSSDNRYVWGFHPSSGAATVSTQGAKVSGAGTVTFNSNIPLSQMVFTNCDSIAANGTTLTSVTFDNTSSASGAISITSSTIAGLQAELDKLVSCNYTNNTVGPALVINYTGSEAGPFSLSMTTGNFSGNTTDIRWQPTTVKTLTISKAGTANPITITSSLGSATITSAAQFELTGIVPGTEVRAYLGTDPATSLEIAGTESTSTVDPEDATKTIFTFAQSYGGQAGYIQIFNVSYQPVFLNVTYSSSDVSIPIQQVVDRNYQP
jgi:hypothetical protein